MTTDEIRESLLAAPHFAEYAGTLGESHLDPDDDEDFALEGCCHECQGVDPAAALDEYELREGQHWGHADDCQWGRLFAWAKEG